MNIIKEGENTEYLEDDDMGYESEKVDRHLASCWRRNLKHDLLIRSRDSSVV
jgi:hypothetical protein